MNHSTKFFFKFNLFNRTYEGRYNYEDFLHHSQIILRNQYPFLPKELLLARAKKHWANKLKEIDKKNQPIVSNEQLVKRSKDRTQCSRNVKRNVLNFDNDNYEINESNTISEANANENSKRNTKSMEDIGSMNNEIEIDMNESPILSSQVRSSFDLIESSSQSSSEFLDETLMNFSPFTDKDERCFISKFIPLDVNDSETIETTNKKDNKGALTTTIEVVEEESYDSYSSQSISIRHINPKISISATTVNLQLNV